MIRTFFPLALSPTRLEQLAREHAWQLDLEYGRSGSQAPIDRLVVNYLRHECTDYDLEQSAPRHRAACEAIARTFPWLAEECRRQVDRRAQQDLEEEELRRALADEEEQHRAERRAMVTRSREVIKGMHVGQRVRFRDGRYPRTGVITKLGRSRVTVAYQVATGRDRGRVRLLHAARITLVKDDPDPSPPTMSAPDTLIRPRNGCVLPWSRCTPCTGSTGAVYAHVPGTLTVLRRVHPMADLRGRPVAEKRGGCGRLVGRP